MKKEFLPSVVNYAIEALQDGVGQDCYAYDLHNELYNSGYFIVGRFEAEEWLKNNVGVFKAIRIVQSYEIENFGEVTTNLHSPENLLNMYIYIMGDEILSQTKSLTEKWDEKLSFEDIDKIIAELKSFVNEELIFNN